MSTTATSFTSGQHFQDFLGKFQSRKLLINNPLNQQQPFTAAPPPYSVEISLHSNVVIILSIVVCGVICSLGLHFLIRCTFFSLSSLVYSESRANSPTPVAEKGIKKKALKTFPVVKYSAELKLPGLDTECVICISDFASGEQVRILPKCNHGFHIRCIDKWLRSHSSCPKCRHCLIETCDKIMGCNNNQTSSSSTGTSMPPAVQETVVSIRAMEPEGLIRNCEGL